MRNRKTSVLLVAGPLLPPPPDPVPDALGIDALNGRMDAPTISPRGVEGGVP